MRRSFKRFYAELYESYVYIFCGCDQILLLLFDYFSNENLSRNSILAKKIRFYFIFSENQNIKF
jgi:hypothetical protein